MRDHFTITISDVHGARHYSFKQFVRKFVWILLALTLTLWAAGAVSIWWLNLKASNIESQHKASVISFKESFEMARADYENLLVEKTKLEQDLLHTSSQVAFLDQALQGLEELVGVDDSAAEIDAPPLALDERVKRVQLVH